MKSILNQLKANADHLSFVTFIACLLFPGFYVGNTQRESLGLELLLTGWLGVLAGHLAWLANPLFLIALFYRKTQPNRAAILIFIGFVLALEFLLHKRIVTDEGDGTALISGIGWGYVLWLISFLFFFGSILEKIEARRIFVYLIYITILVLITSFTYVYFFSTTSHWKLLKERERRFSELCKITGEQFYTKRNSPILGIYFSEPGGAGYYSVYYGKISGSITSSIFTSGGLDEIPLIERRNNEANPTQPYVRGRQIGTKEELVSELRSNYFVLITDLTHGVPHELALSGRQLVVYELGVDKPLAKMAYAVSREEKKFCGPLDKDNNFNEAHFVYKALGLVK